MPYHACYLCGADSANGEDFCLPCLAELPWNAHACRGCAVPLTTPGTDYCRQCLSQPAAFEHCFVPMKYDKPIDLMLLSYKQYADEHAGAILGRLLLNALPSSAFDLLCDSAVIAVPMFTADLRRRGFNPAHQLASNLAKKLALPINYQLFCQRQHDPQKGLSAAQRRRNLHGVFRFEGKAPEHCLIVDDVMTTGATVQTVAAELKRQGTECVSVVCLARTPSPND